MTDDFGVGSRFWSTRTVILESEVEQLHLPHGFMKAKEINSTEIYTQYDTYFTKNKAIDHLICELLKLRD